MKNTIIEHTSGSAIRNCVVEGDNFPIIDYHGWTIWSGYNDTDDRGYYFVCDEEGEDIGTSDFTIKDAMNTIDNAIKSIEEEQE